MILEIDTTYLTENHITAHQYTILKLASENNTHLLKRYLGYSDSLKTLYSDLNILYKRGLLENAPNDNAILTSIRVSENFNRHLSFDTDPFEELYNAYPIKVLRPDGEYDYLRVDQKRSKKIYRNVIRLNRAKHEFILQCLKAEVESRSKRGQLPFMKRMPAWLVSESWKIYADLIERNQGTTPDKNKASYGQDIE